MQLTFCARGQERVAILPSRAEAILDLSRLVNTSRRDLFPCMLD